MESLGQKLRETREQHNFSIEQVARDTHISKQYLEALEQEDFSMIPGETYIIGFLRNYAEYLSLNPEELVALYKNIQIQEQPLPMTELLDRSRPKFSARIFVLLVIILAVLGAGGYLIYRFLISPERQAAPRAAAAAQEVRQPSAQQPEGEELLFQDEAVTRWFDLDDTIGFPLNGNTYRLQIIDIDKTLTIKVPGGTLDMPIGQDRQLDVNGDGRNDLRILLNDLDATDVAKRANLSLYKITKATVPEVAEAGELEEAVPAGQEEAVEPAVSEPIAAEPSAGATTIISADTPAPFRVTISFRGYCLFRYLVDNDIREERFFHKGESFSLDARNGVQLWISNAGVVRLMVAGREIEVGRPGAVTTRQIRWSRDDAGGQYALEVVSKE
jgi:cytoskeleton protein RodZ